MKEPLAAARPVVFDAIETVNGLRIGVAQLNSPQSLNALTLEMIRLLDRKLREWSDDPQIVCVVLLGCGEKAFCAGGDVRALYRSIIEHSTGPNPYALAFFTEEYRLDYLLHTYRKPVLVWGDAIVMGGGLGLLAGASHRVVTEKSRIAMPEISIGLFPDVGGSWFLRCMPKRSGLFVSLTGAAINGHDAKLTGLADYCLRSSDRSAVIKRARALDWKGVPSLDRILLSQLLNEFAANATGVFALSNLLEHEEEIESLCEGAAFDVVAQRIANFAGPQEWIRRASQTFTAGSPMSAALTWELRSRAEHMSLADVFRMELIVALQCCAHPDFPEGVRAALIDKDRAPRWTPDRIELIDAGALLEYFALPSWLAGVHPLSDL